MKSLIICAVTAIVLLFASCDKEEPDLMNQEDTVLSVNPEIAGVSTRAAISAFPNGSALGLFVTTGTLGENYNGIVANANVKSVFNSSSNVWMQTPAVYLSSTNATVYAYYPYSSANNNGELIPVDHINQNDYMYGTHTTNEAINNGRPNVDLTMRHALTLLQFKFKRSNYTGAGVVSSIEVANGSGKTCIFSRGTLNVATGVITNTTGQNQSARIQNSAGLYTIPGSESSVESPNLRIMLLPVSKTAAAGDVKVYFTIDNKVYIWNVPAPTTWNAGTKNTYNITLSGTGLSVGNVIIRDWTTGMSGSAELN